MYQSVHGGDIYNESLKKDPVGILDYSVNINPLGVPAGIRKALQKAITDCVKYPDPFCRALRKKLGASLKISPAEIYCGNGAADVLFRLLAALRPKRTLILAPTFADYEKAAVVAGSKVDHFILEPERGFTVTSQILKAITKRTGMVILCNPNNPTGLLISKTLLLKVLERCKDFGTPLLVDECFLEFLPDWEEYSLLDVLDRYPNLIILKAFTKIYAIPGVRLGYCLTSDANLIERLYECGQDWNVSVLAQVAGVAALDEKEYLIASRALIAQERTYMIAQLRLIGFTVWEGTANYLFLRSNRGIDWKDALKKRGILIRDCSNYRGLGPGYFRVAVKTRRDNRKLIKYMKDIVKNALINGTN